MKKIEKFRFTRQGNCLELQIMGSKPQSVFFKEILRQQRGMPAGSISEDKKKQLFIKAGGYIFAGPTQVEEAICLTRLVLFRRGDVWYYQHYNAEKAKALGKQLKLRQMNDMGDMVFVNESQISVAYDNMVRSWPIQSYEIISNVWGEDVVLIKKSGEENYHLLNNSGVTTLGVGYTNRLYKNSEGMFILLHYDYKAKDYRIIFEHCDMLFDKRFDVGNAVMVLYGDLMLGRLFFIKKGRLVLEREGNFTLFEEQVKTSKQKSSESMVKLTFDGCVYAVKGNKLTS